MDKMKREETSEVLEPTEEMRQETAEEETKEKTEVHTEKKQKKEKRKKNGRGIRTMLRILQHAALGVTVFSLLIVVVCGTVRISGVHSEGNYTNFTGYSDPGTPFEDSEAFNTIFGYAVADIIRFGVVSSQMENGGDVFDGNKIVDVTAYNYRNDVLPEQYVTANYRLEDLLKWQNYGFSYSDVEMTEAEAEAFLADTTQITSINKNSGYQNTTDANYLKSDVKTYTSINDVQTGEELNVTYYEWDEDSGFVAGYQPIGALAEHADAPAQETDARAEDKAEPLYWDADEPVYAYRVLINRYKTAEGKNLEEYVSDWTHYYDLCGNVSRAAENLAYNYNEYVECKEYFDSKNSNVRYLIEKPVGDEIQSYSNTEAGSPYREHMMQCMTDVALMGKETSTPFSSEKFIYYCPADMAYVTNTDITESTVRRILQAYDYAYPEATRIWISVDPSYPAVDAFTRAAEYLPNLWQWLVAAVIAGLLYLFLFIYQTIVTGRVYDENGEKHIRLQAFDEVPTEAAALIACIVMFLAFWILVILAAAGGIDPTDMDFYREAIHENWFKSVAILLVFAADVLFTFFFYSLVRRIKARTFWKNSYLCRLVNWLKQFAWKVYDNSGIVLRTWVPYGIVILMNLVLMFFACQTSGGGLLVLFFLAVIDVIVGVLLYKDARERQDIVKGIEIIAAGQVEHQIDMEDLHGDNKVLAASVNSIGKGIQEAVEISMKDERMKADLITNVSHDIKTPLTSIINYVDLLKREQMESEKAQNYIRVLDEKSQRLKQLTDDLVEASKITSGNISLHFERINLTELMNQTIGEFSEKFEEKGLVTVMNVNTKQVMIEADSRRIWRVMENLFNNIYKYAMPGTRVYVTMDRAGEDKQSVQISIKNISQNYLNCKPEELTERFIRGDESRTTEGSGLGLSIAKNLTLAQKGSFEIELDGDLFKVIMTFPAAKEEG